jgi:hypothetical protein
VSVFTRRQQNYQMSLILFLTFLACASQHPVDLFVYGVNTLCEACLSLHKFGDSWNGEPLDLKQEGSVAQTKKAASRNPSNLGMVVVRAKLISYIQVSAKRSQNYDFVH